MDKHIILVAIAAVIGTLGAAQTAANNYRGSLALVDLVFSIATWLVIVYVGYVLYLGIRYLINPKS